MQKEVEATFLSVNKDAVRNQLTKTGFELKTPEYLMCRKIFDFSRIAPGKIKWGRVRQEADKVTMSIKEIRGPGINDVYEVELVVDDFDTAVSFFEACSIPVKSFQESMREVWERNGVEVMIDTWPGLNPFMEIEGVDEATVRHTTKELGFDFEHAVFGSADLVYEKELGIPAKVIDRLPRITFADPPTKNIPKVSG
ncbi:hypothetical protein BK004_01000 [bacterium CG10_46_32]|nr:MAG: hypothetical protein BK004_01000 [bacterium CG10_46_32]PIR56469.1 MAG: hypothetical protein COU73_01010 [Parcubacteria group bacterium CG10_big_fil_rev_8_21_14_0_10_46_32]